MWGGWLCKKPFQKELAMYMLTFDPGQRLDPKKGFGGPKQGLEKIYSLNCDTRQKFHKTKVVGKVCFSGGPIIFFGP